jgi:hypothetical protein
MGGTLAPVYALVTALTALLVATVLAPVLRLMLEPGVVLPRQIRGRTPAAAGSLSVLLAAAVLLPMGGDGILVPFADTPIAFGLFSALALFLIGSTPGYASLPAYGRLAIQAAVAFLAVLGGAHALTGSLATHALTALGPVVAMNAIEGLRRSRGVAVCTAAVVAGFLAWVAAAFNEPGLSDLNLGLCGALVALLVLQLVPKVSLHTELCAGGRLAVGFLIGMSYVRLAPQATPETQAWMLLPMLLPLTALVVSALAAASRPLWARWRPSHYRPLQWLGLKPTHLLALAVLVNANVALAALRVLGMF